MTLSALLIDTDRSDAAAHLKLGMALMALGRHAKALPALDDAAPAAYVELTAARAADPDRLAELAPGLAATGGGVPLVRFRGRCE